jgi:hypothetical protein
VGKRDGAGWISRVVRAETQSAGIRGERNGFTAEMTAKSKEGPRTEEGTMTKQREAGVWSAWARRMIAAEVGKTVVWRETAIDSVLGNMGKVSSAYWIQSGGQKLYEV